jgi:hypothetical protein
MNEILLAATMACMSANLAQLAVPRWPLMCMGAPIQRTMDIHAERHASGPDIWCPLPKDGAQIEERDCMIWPSQGVSRGGGTFASVPRAEKR